MRYDHFHAEWEKDGERGEIEGGWTGFPSTWDDMTKEESDKWLYTLCVNWGMPEHAKIKHIWLAG
jgi:hypothetical protein